MEGGAPVPAHKLLLCCCESAYFDALFLGGFSEGTDHVSDYEARHSSRLADGGAAAAGCGGGAGEAVTGQPRGALTRLRLPTDMTRRTLLAVLRYLYTGASPIGRSGKTAGETAAETAGETGASPIGPPAHGGAGGEAGQSGERGADGGSDAEAWAEESVELVALLRAADALGMGSLRRLCEGRLSEAVDEEQAAGG